MTIERKTIREALVTILKNDVGVLALVDIENIQDTRVREVFQNDDNNDMLPAIIVQTSGEVIEETVMSAREHKRGIQLSVVIIAEATTGIQGILDDIADAVEVAIYKDDTWGGLLYDLTYNAVGIDFDASGSTINGTAVLQFNAVYVRDAPRILEDGVDGELLKTNVKYDIVVPDGSLEQEETIETAGS